MLVMELRQRKWSLEIGLGIKGCSRVKEEMGEAPRHSATRHHGVKVSVKACDQACDNAFNETARDDGEETEEEEEERK